MSHILKGIMTELFLWLNLGTYSTSKEVVSTRGDQSMIQEVNLEGMLRDRLKAGLIL